MFDQLMKSLEGRKTYLQVAAGFAVIGFVHLGLLDLDIQLKQDLVNALILGAIAALRASK